VSPTLTHVLLLTCHLWSSCCCSSRAFKIQKTQVVLKKKVHSNNVHPPCRINRQILQLEIYPIARQIYVLITLLYSHGGLFSSPNLLQTNACVKLVPRFHLNFGHACKLVHCPVDLIFFFTFRFNYHINQRLNNRSNQYFLSPIRLHLGSRESLI
jgi:hypothetical protein